jgi:hypothetical protein
MQGKPGISTGCKGSRKHTGYADEKWLWGYLLGRRGRSRKRWGRFRGHLNNGGQELNISYSGMIQFVCNMSP